LISVFGDFCTEASNLGGILLPIWLYVRGSSSRCESASGFCLIWVLPSGLGRSTVSGNWGRIILLSLHGPGRVAAVLGF
jgi:hypothetical protein